MQQNDLLYNKTNKEYKNTQKKKEVWEAIGLELGASGKKIQNKYGEAISKYIFNQIGDACSKRWSSLRDKYCREIRRKACSSGSGAVAETKWPHFDSLSFLSGHMRGGR